MYFLSQVCILCSCLVQISFSELLVLMNHSNVTVEIFTDLQALFGPPLPFSGLKGLVVAASPADGCSTIAPPPKIANHSVGFISLVRRYNCSFVDKVLNAQAAGYKGVIVRNVGSNSVEVMSGNHDTELVQIPSVFVGQDDGLILHANFQYNSGYHVVITDDFPIRIQDYLIPFAITIGICLFLMLIFMIVKWVRDYKQSRRHRLSSRALKKIPIHKFKKGDPFDCCAICLDEYVENDKLRVLPCSHAYHTKCIDPWLTKNRRVCPVCKRKVVTGDENPSDLEDDSEDETAPLIDAGNNTQGGTFIPQRENPFQWAERRLERMRNSSNAPSYYNFDDDSSSEEEGNEDLRETGQEPPEMNLQQEAPYVVAEQEIPQENIIDHSTKDVPDIHVISSSGEVKEAKNSIPEVENEAPPTQESGSNVCNV